MYYFVGVALLFVSCNGQEIIDTNEMCVTRNGYFRADNSCDAYYECRDYQPSMMFCPDGLNYNPKAEWPNYPCNYPSDVPCKGSSQPSKPTLECPRQNGFFRSPSAAAKNDCGQYRLCVDGRAYDMYCPYGLAFDFKSARCDWPDRVPECNFEDYFGFTCPDTDYDEDGYPLVTNHKYEDHCYMFLSCQYGRARLLSCDPGYAFDPVAATCVNADLVSCESREVSESTEYDETTENDNTEDNEATEPNVTIA